MDKTSGKLTVFFEDPFWVGVFQRVQDGKLYACKVVFGRQPRDQEVYEFILRHYGELSFSPAVDWEEKQRADNPKRRQRQVRRQLAAAGAGTGRTPCAVRTVPTPVRPGDDTIREGPSR